MNTPFHDEATRCRIAQVAWSKVPVEQRLAYVRRLRHLLVDFADSLALTVTQDVGRPADEVLATDILPTADAWLFLERRAGRLLQPRSVPRSDRPLWLIGSRDTVYHRPHGVVGIIGTWNYPIFLNAVPIVQALIAGNGVLWKASEQTPMLAVALTELIQKAGFPADLLIALPATREAGPELAETMIDHLVFTGSAPICRWPRGRPGSA
ncbi:MAG: aldehyde dehydrogenase family protein [Planctomycetes bacterium]|nr:aldehyde dehydrogenase family protein [Planctomycetota bacterium]